MLVECWMSMSLPSKSDWMEIDDLSYQQSIQFMIMRIDRFEDIHLLLLLNISFNGFDSSPIHFSMISSSSYN